MRRWELSTRLRVARLRAEMTIEQVAQALDVSSAKISRIETGNRGVQPRDVRDLAELYQLSPAESEELIALARGAREQGWWQRFDKIEPSAATYLGLETAATSLDWFESQRLPGLLQIPDYTRALLKGINRADTWRPEFVDEQVILRARRQERLTNEPVLRLHAVLDESALRHRIGSADIMARQMKYIEQLSDLPNVTIQLLSFESQATPGLNGPFTIFMFAQKLMSDVVYIEGNNGEFFHEAADEVEKYHRIFAILTEAALPALQSSERFSAIGADWQRQLP